MDSAQPNPSTPKLPLDQEKENTRYSLQHDEVNEVITSEAKRVDTYDSEDEDMELVEDSIPKKDTFDDLTPIVKK